MIIADRLVYYNFIPT